MPADRAGSIGSAKRTQFQGDFLAGNRLFPLLRQSKMGVCQISTLHRRVSLIGIRTPGSRR
ncbi:hypothetical protein C5Y97_00120 [Blastopirellula marina]|uniref:Uncharacterized protein n=1 Tax=Blastopirellula marina TaxID=124 RepID=A0A2S8GFW7_9BACT|nr:hypothetical protein C5Y98_00120 [Blastopirellula marina]PTL46669.1 hypothetical protein C5Y97_00120 [Blastopirellula marina]